MNNEKQKLNIDEVDLVEEDGSEDEAIFGTVSGVENEAIKNELVNLLTNMLNELTEEEREVVIRRNGFYTEDGKPETRRSISKKMGITMRKVYILECAAYRKLYKMARFKQLRDYIL